MTRLPLPEAKLCDAGPQDGLAVLGPCALHVRQAADTPFLLSMLCGKGCFKETKRAPDAEKYRNKSNHTELRRS